MVTVYFEKFTLSDVASPNQTDVKVSLIYITSTTSCKGHPGKASLNIRKSGVYRGIYYFSYFG